MGECDVSSFILSDVIGIGDAEFDVVSTLVFLTIKRSLTGPWS
jgi:hypothetical protein